jgi:hypothetical protein
MDYVVACPNCSGHLKVSDRMIGFTVTCPRCGNPCIPDPPPWSMPTPEAKTGTRLARLIQILPPLSIGLLLGLLLGGAGGFYFGYKDGARREAVLRALAIPDPEPDPQPEPDTESPPQKKTSSSDKQ